MVCLAIFSLIRVTLSVIFAQMFGVQPPQTLYHTRHSPKPTDRVHSTERLSHTEREAVLPTGRNVNQSSYMTKASKVIRHRAGSHSESIIPLLDSPGSPGNLASAVYMHYRNSLDSLNEIIDRVSPPSNLLRGTNAHTEAAGRQGVSG